MADSVSKMTNDAMTNDAMTNDAMANYWALVIGH